MQGSLVCDVNGSEYCLAPQASTALGLRVPPQGASLSNPVRRIPFLRPYAGVILYLCQLFLYMIHVQLLATVLQHQELSSATAATLLAVLSRCQP